MHYDLMRFFLICLVFTFRDFLRLFVKRILTVILLIIIKAAKIAGLYVISLTKSLATTRIIGVFSLIGLLLVCLFGIPLVIGAFSLCSGGRGFRGLDC